MTPFLKNIANEIIVNHKNNLQEVCIIVPNRRSILYLKKYLCENIQQPTWSPKIWSIDDFVWEATHLQPCEKIDLLFDLYAIHLNLSNNGTRNFDDFIQWGDMILSDFDEIDSYQVDTKQLFEYLSEAKAIELWNTDGSPLTERELNYLSFYRSLDNYYRLLREKVLNENQAWIRLAYRVFCEKFDEYFRPYENKHFYIIGFNALTTTEETLFKLISKQATTNIIWDFDDYYLQPQQEAGFFLRKNFQKFGKAKTNNTDYKEKKDFHIWPISKNLGQAITVNQILQSLSNDDLSETAIILNDESLLMPIINFLPKTCDKFNITMGYPLKSTQLYELFISWILLFTTASKNDDHFYYKDLFNFLQHPLFQRYIENSNPEMLQNIEKSISQYKQNAIPFLSISDIKTKIFNNDATAFQPLAPIFSPWNHSLNNALSGLQCLATILQECFEHEEDSINMACLFPLQKNIHCLQKMTTRYSEIQTGIKSISYIFQQIFSSITIPFAGEPLGGLQIMGILESRLLDFKNIIMVSVNEGMLPKNATLKTFIPFDIRKKFGLPTISEQNAITSYHFYRSIQRAEQIHLLYNCAESSGLGSNEKSRYITQLDFELQRYNPQVSFTTHQEPLNNVIFSPLAPPVITKDDNIMDKLNQLAEKGFSPSSFNNFLECSLKFYYEYVLKIKPQEELKENIDNALLGTITHKALEILHKDFVKRVLQENDIKQMLISYEGILSDSFKSIWTNGDFQKGRNYLFYYAAKQWIENFIKQERSFISKNYVIVAQEHKMQHPIAVTIGDVTKNVIVSGIADRICSYNNMIQVIDFKTGNVTAPDVKIEDFDTFINELFQTKPKPKALQLLMYAWLFKNGNSVLNSDLPMNAAIISLQKPSQDFSLKIKDSDTVSDNVLDKTEQLLGKIITKIFDQTIPFEATTNTQTCSYCDFSALCRWKNIKNSPKDAN